MQGVVDLVDTGQCGQMRVQLEICEGHIKINIGYSWQLCKHLGCTWVSVLCTSIWAVHGFLFVACCGVYICLHSVYVEIIEDMGKKHLLQG